MKFLKKALCLCLLACLLLSLASCGTKAEDGRTALTVNGTKVSADEMRYILGNLRRDLAGTGREDSLADEAVKQCRRAEAIRRLAKKHKVTLGTDGEKALKERLAAFRGSYADEDAFRNGLKDAYLTEYSLEKMLRSEALWQKLYDSLTDEMSFTIRADDETLLADIKENFRCAGQILILNEEGEDPAENRRIAEEALKRLEGGEDFLKLADELGEDKGMRDSGYYFTKGQLLEYFEEAAFSLEVGQRTGVVECPLGYAIIERFPMDEKYISSHLETLRTAYKARVFNEMLSDAMDDVKVRTTDLFDTLVAETK